MAESLVVSGLVSKRAQVAGQIASYKTEIIRLQESLSHLAVISALMGEMAENGLDFRVALSKIDIKSKQSRGGAAKGRFGGRKQIDLLATKVEK